MNKASLRFCILIAISSFAFFSCKKEHDLNKYPTNSRLLNLTRRIDSLDSVGGGHSGVVLATVNENFRFLYDNYNRVSQIYYTTNAVATPNTISTFTYAHDTIFKTIRSINETFMELDTFVTDYHGHITSTYINGHVINYSYYGDLLVRVDSTNGAAGYSNYTSYNGNFTASKSSLGAGYDGRYTYFTDMPNRTGDYLYIRSMVRYGVNLYQNRSLINTIDLPGYFTTATYVIDGDSKVTQTTAITAYINKFSQRDTYDIQYEKY